MHLTSVGAGQLQVYRYCLFIKPRLHDTTVQPVWQPAVSCRQTSNRLSKGLSNRWRNSHCSFNRLSNRVVQPVWQPAVYTIQPFVKPVVKRVSQPVECLYTRYNRLSNRYDNRFDNGFDNRLYRVYKHLPGCQTGLTTVWQQVVSCIGAEVIRLINYAARNKQMARQRQEHCVQHSATVRIIRILFLTVKYV